MNVIYKHTIPVDDAVHAVTMGFADEIVHVDCASDPSVVSFWFIRTLDMDVPTYKRTFRVVATGQPHEGIYRGTALALDGRLVWHLIEVSK